VEAERAAQREKHTAEQKNQATVSQTKGVTQDADVLARVESYTAGVLKSHSERLGEAQYLQFRHYLIGKFGSAKAAYKALDTNGNGLLSLGEITMSLDRLHLNLHHEISHDFDIRAVFKVLDIDGSGELTMFELFNSDPDEDRRKLREERKAELLRRKKERHREEEEMALKEQERVHEPALRREETMVVLDEVEAFRNYLVKHFGTKEEAFAMLDTDGSGMISFGELRVALERHSISVKQVVCEKTSLSKIFRRLDANGKGELSFEQLMVSAPGTKVKRKKSVHAIMQDITVEVHELPEEEMSESLLNIVKFLNGPKQKTLNLQWGHVGREGAHRLAAGLQALTQTRKIKLLQLEGNYFTTNGVRPLLAAMEKFCQVEKLVLAWNGIDNHAAERLAHAITEVKTLKELDLQNNRIGDQGAERIARAVGDHKIGLKLLDMQHNLMAVSGLMNFVMRVVKE
jgi:Ca2+-binding EF-hand superfamily protein